MIIAFCLEGIEKEEEACGYSHVVSVQGWRYFSKTVSVFATER